MATASTIAVGAQAAARRAWAEDAHRLSGYARVHEVLRPTTPPATVALWAAELAEWTAQAAARALKAGALAEHDAATLAECVGAVRAAASNDALFAAAAVLAAALSTVI